MRSPFEDLYRTHFDRAVKLAEGTFHVPHEAATKLAQEVLLSYLRLAGSTGDFDVWLVGAICRASQCWWRTARRTGLRRSADRRQRPKFRLP